MNLIERRRQMMMSKSLPYDAKIEYLESSGTQYINTGYIPNVNSYAEVEFAIVLQSGTGYFGARKEPYRFCCTSFSNGTMAAMAMTDNTWPTNRKTVSTQTFYIAIAQNGSYSIDNVSGTTTSLASFDINDPFYLFGMRTSNNQFVVSWIKIKKVVLKDNGVTVMDMIPVRVGTTGYMYDRVSGQLFGNQGTGDFILGPDK